MLWVRWVPSAQHPCLNDAYDVNLSDLVSTGHPPFINKQGCFQSGLQNNEVLSKRGSSVQYKVKIACAETAIQVSVFLLQPKRPEQTSGNFHPLTPSILFQITVWIKYINVYSCQGELNHYCSHKVLQWTRHHKVTLLVFTGVPNRQRQYHTHIYRTKKNIIFQ